MAISVKKVSISIEAGELKWMQHQARRQGASVSALFTEGARLLRRREARKKLLADLGDAANLTDADRTAIDSEWRG